MPNEDLQNKILELESKIRTLESNFGKHQHDGIDGTNTLRKTLTIDPDQSIKVGYCEMASAQIKDIGLATEVYEHAIGVGKSDGKTGFTNKADILQLSFIHRPNNTARISNFVGLATPAVSTMEGVTVSTTSGGNTVTISGYNFVTNELANAFISIYNSSGIVETHQIDSNTATQVTIKTTWAVSTANGTFLIYSPVYLGDPGILFKRLYLTEGVDGGLRIGGGPTDTGSKQNGLLYMDATGDLYWRNKAGTATKLIYTPPTGISGEYYVSDSSGGAVTRKLTFTDGILVNNV
jgi:hypothetical protein